MADKLRERCKQIADKLKMDSILRRGNPVETLYEFVLSERGRHASPLLDKTAPVILYFKDDVEREEFLAIIREAKPGMTARTLP